MAKQQIIISDREGNTLHTYEKKFPKIADSVSNMWETVNSILFAKVDVGGSFGNEREVALYSENFQIFFITTR